MEFKWTQPDWVHIMRKSMCLLSGISAGAALIGALIFGVFTLTANAESEDALSEPIYRQLELFGEVIDRVRTSYVDVPDNKQLVEDALKGMLTSLDPHSDYLSPDALEEMLEETSGTFGGLGIEVTMEEGLVKVVAPIDDTPAAKAGVLAGDLIVEIDGEQVFGLTLDQAIDRMRGPVGSDVNLTLTREGAGSLINVNIVRDVIKVRSVRFSLEEDVGYVRLASFSETATEGVSDAIKSILDEAGDQGVKGFVFDLRNNPGGLLDQAVMVSDLFLERGEIVSTRGRDPRDIRRETAVKDDFDQLTKDLPLVILVNGGSASSSEIVAGALQDHKRATVVGTKSFGKGSVQTILPLRNLGGAIRLTTHRYYTPSGKSIQATGVVPDIEVKQTVPEEFRRFDRPVGETNLRGHLENADPEDDQTHSSADDNQIQGDSSENQDKQEEQSGSSVFVPADKEQDTQLLYALNLVRGVEKHDSFPANPMIE